MGLGGILQELKREGVLKVYLDYRSGRGFDYSGNSNNATNLFSPIHWTKKAIAANGFMYPSIINTATLQALTTGTIISKIKTDRSYSNYIIYKQNQISLNHNYGLGQMILSSNVASSALNFVGGSIDVHAVDFDNAGGTPKYYFNGVFFANMSVGLTIVGSANDVYVNFCNTTDFSNAQYFLLISRKLTATEHARVYGQLENMKWNTKGLTPGPMMP